MEIVNDIFACADAMTMSAKKDAFANMGGWLALNNDDLAEAARTQTHPYRGISNLWRLGGARS